MKVPPPLLLPPKLPDSIEPSVTPASDPPPLGKDDGTEPLLQPAKTRAPVATAARMEDRRERPTGRSLHRDGWIRRTTDDRHSGVTAAGNRVEDSGTRRESACLGTMAWRAIHAALVGAMFSCAWVAACGGSERSLGGPDAGGALEGGTTPVSPPSSGSSSSGSSSGSAGGSSSGPSSSSGDGASPPVDAGPAPVTCAAALAQLGSCMTYADFTAKNASGYSASDIADWSTRQSGGCTGCHTQGSGGFCDSSDPMLMFQMTQKAGCIDAWVRETCDASGDVTGFAPSTLIPDEGAMDCGQGTPCHPAYELPPGMLAAMDAFVNDAIARWKTGACK